MPYSSKWREALREQDRSNVKKGVMQRMTTTPDTRSVQHTRGQWIADEHVRERSSSVSVIAVRDGRRRETVADIRWPINGGAETRMANARLMAAAPRLLRAAATILAICGGDEGKEWDELRAAIAKAEGREL